MSVFVQDTDFTLYHGDCLDVLRTLEPSSVHCCVTSPPYWGLRDYAHAGQLGLEATPGEYVDGLVAVMREVRRVLADAGTLWLNLGDTYASKARGSDAGWESSRLTNPGGSQKAQAASLRSTGERHRGKSSGLKEKDLVGIPWRVAFALQADGWYLRSDIIWSKLNPMPESVTDRPTKAHEYVFLLSKSARYYYDADAVREPYRYDGRKVTTVVGREGSLQHRNGERWPGIGKAQAQARAEASPAGADESEPMDIVNVGRNVRTVWEISTQPYAEAHFATFPQELPRRCIAAGCAAGGTVLDPFMGSGTTALVARSLGRRSIGIELNGDYCSLAARRLGQQSLLTEGVA